MLNRMAIAFIHFYQRYISPWLGHGKCKYIPTCSAYGLEAFRRFRFPTALTLTLWRILRCNPFSKGGVDYLR